MGNRAIIKGKGQKTGLYVHWNGGYESVYPITQYCKLKGYRSPANDDYGLARLAQVYGNFFGGSTSVGIASNLPVRINDKIGQEQCWDNGVYEIDSNWELAHYNGEDNVDPYVSDEDLIDFMIYLNNRMPEHDRLDEAYIRAEKVSVDTLNIGDVVYVGWDEQIMVTVKGYGSDEYVNGTNVAGCPYVNLYGKDGDYTKNINNYIREKTIRKVRECDIPENFFECMDIRDWLIETEEHKYNSIGLPYYILGHNDKYVYALVFKKVDCNWVCALCMQPKGQHEHDLSMDWKIPTYERNGETYIKPIEIPVYRVSTVGFDIAQKMMKAYDELVYYVEKGVVVID